MQRTTTILACLFLCAACIAQQYPFVHYTPRDGLVNSRVRKAYQDSKGRMYFLTYGGLSVYDGARFTNYTTQNGLASDLVNDILEVGEDSFLVASNSSWYVNVLVKGKMNRLTTHGPLSPINQFCPDNHGKIYLSSDDGLFVLQKNNIVRLNVSEMTREGTLPFLEKIILFGNYLVLSTSEMRSHDALYLYDIKNNRVCDAWHHSEIFLLGRDPRNVIWAFTEGRSFTLDSIALSKGKLALQPSSQYDELKKYSTRLITFNDSNVWLSDENYATKEILRLEKDGHVTRVPLPEQSAASHISDIFVDKENTIWICNEGQGVFKFVKSPLQIFAKPLASKTQISSVFYHADTTWFTASKSLFRKSGESLDEFTCNLGNAPIVFNQTFNSLLARDDKNIYRGTMYQKKIYFNKIISLDNADHFTSRTLVDNNGAILSCQLTSLNVWSNNKLIHHLELKKNEHIEELAFDDKNLLWVVTRSSGIFLFSLEPQNASGYLQPIYQIPPEQIAGSPRCFLIDKNHLIWIGTRSDGLLTYRQNAGKLILVSHFDAAHGLTDNYVTSIACDSAENIIIGTQMGLDRLVHTGKNSYRIENLSKGNNFFAYINQTWTDHRHRSFAISNNGALLEVSEQGKEDSLRSPQLLVEEMKVNGHLTLVSQKKFSYKENNISLFVAAPSFIDEKQVKFAYLLQGSGNDMWSDTSTSNAVINLINLPPGNYNLHVRAFFPSSFYPPVESSYSFSIAPAWYQVWWFRLLVATALVTLVIVVLRFYYRRKLEKQKIVLEKQQAIEKERTRIATDMHDDLGAGLSRIKFLSQSILNKETKNEVLKTELEKITAFSDEMSEKMGEIVWALNQKNDTLADLIAYTRSYAVEYLGNHGIECDADTPSNLPNTFITGEIRRNIFLSVKECLHNIVKHACATKVCFSVQLNSAMEIVIHDNGKGIDWDNRRAFSNGIENVNRRMKEIQGAVDYANEQGTKVSLTIPLTL
jgi:signal transduction histidine kinase/ligand-binding sensor domain-containing protein